VESASPQHLVDQSIESGPPGNRTPNLQIKSQLLDLLAQPTQGLKIKLICQYRSLSQGRS
jgi:hypothetical protein